MRLNFIQRTGRRQASTNPRLYLAALLAAFLDFSQPTTLFAAPPPDLPEHLVAPWSSSGQFPCWVSGGIAFDKQAQAVSSVLFSQEYRDHLASILNRPRSSDESCYEYGEVYDEVMNPPRRGSLESALETSTFAFRARATASVGGFFGSVPGTLIRVQPIEVFRQDQDVFKAETYLVFLPVGRVEIGAQTICKRDHRYSDLPENGDEVVVFVPKWSGAASGELLDLIDENGLITIHQDGAVSLPIGYRNSIREVKNGAQLVEQLRRAAASGSEP